MGATSRTPKARSRLPAALSDANINAAAVGSTAYTPPVAYSLGGSLNTADHALDRGANHPAGHRCRGIATRDVASLMRDP